MRDESDYRELAVAHFTGSRFDVDLENAIATIDGVFAEMSSQLFKFKNKDSEAYKEAANRLRILGKNFAVLQRVHSDNDVLKNLLVQAVNELADYKRIHKPEEHDTISG